MTIGSRAQVLHGTADETSGGLKKKDLVLCKKSGEIVSKDKSKSEKKNPWIVALAAAKKKLKIPKGDFILPTKGSALYKKAMELKK
jgi:hypothetical protein